MVTKCPPSFTEYASACVQDGPSTIVYKELPRITGAISFYLSSEITEHFCPFDLNLGRFGPKFHIFQRFADIAINPRLVFFYHPHNSNPRPANAAALLRQALAVTSAVGTLDINLTDTT